MAGVDWGYYKNPRFGDANDKYLPISGEGDTVATQVCVCINKLVYKWYNDGDVYDNTYQLHGWWNDLSSFANWLCTYIPGAKEILSEIEKCCTEEDYEELLQRLADSYLNLDFLNRYATAPKIGSVYHCDGPFKYCECNDEDPDDGWDDEWEEDEEGEEYD